MAGSFRSQSKQVIRQLKKELEDITFDVATNILKGSTDRIKAHRGGEGQALGPYSRESDLAASGYISTETFNGHGGGLKRMKSARLTTTGNKTQQQSRDVKRGLFAEPAVVKKQAGSVRVKVAYAAGRANLMHNGYYDVNTGHFMFGTPFLENAAKENQSYFLQRVAAATQRLRLIEEPRYKKGSVEWYESLSPFEQMQARIDAENAMLADVTRSQAKEMAELWRDFRTMADINFGRERSRKTGMARTSNAPGASGRRRGARGGLIEVYSWESAQERISRITDAFESFSVARAHTGEYDGSRQSADSGGYGRNAMEDFVRRALRRGR